MSRSRVIVTGVKEIDQKLQQLEPRLQKKTLNRALRPAAKIVQAEAKQNAPVDTGELRKHIVVRTTRKNKRREVGIDVRVDAADQFPKAGVMEFGSETVAPRAYMRRAADTKGDEARQVAKKNLLELLEEIIDRG